MKSFVTPSTISLITWFEVLIDERFSTEWAHGPNTSGGQKTVKLIFSPFALTLDGERAQFQASSSASFFEALYAVRGSFVERASSYVTGFQSSDVYV
jgi:hypothetical protein